MSLDKPIGSMVLWLLYGIDAKFFGLYGVRNGFSPKGQYWGLQSRISKGVQGHMPPENVKILCKTYRDAISFILNKQLLYLNHQREVVS